MSEKINVLDIEIDKFTAKEVMRKSIGYMASEPISVIEMVTADGLMQMNEIEHLKEEVCRFELVIAGDTAVLEAAGVTEERYIRETREWTYLRLFLKYLHKNHRRVYLLVESEEEGDSLYSWFESHYSGLQVVGIAKVSAGNRVDDMIVNAVNGGEADCVISALSAPLQEEFAVKNRHTLNARIWLGAGRGILSLASGRNGQGKLTQFVVKHFFKKEIEKQKKTQQTGEEK